MRDSLPLSSYSHSYHYYTCCKCILICNNVGNLEAPKNACLKTDKPSRGEKMKTPISILMEHFHMYPKQFIDLASTQYIHLVNVFKRVESLFLSM